MSSFTRILALLKRNGVEFIVVGGIAAGAHGAARPTYDVDVVYGRTSGNIARLVKCLAEFDPYPRGAPPGLPFIWDPRTIESGLNFTLVTSLGEIDLLGEIGGSGYEDLLPHSIEMTVLGERCRCLKLDKLIEVKRAAGRPKDFEALAELEALLEEYNRQDGDGPAT